MTATAAPVARRPRRQEPARREGGRDDAVEGTLALARKLLVHRKNPNKQIFLITDGKPSAIWERGRLYKNPFGLDLKIVNRTLEEADACRRDGITITTFMIATDSYLVAFVDKLTKINRGRAYYASPYNLAEFLFTDYIRNRKKFVH